MTPRTFLAFLIVFVILKVFLDLPEFFFGIVSLIHYGVPNAEKVSQTTTSSGEASLVSPFS